jgi:surface protein
MKKYLLSIICTLLPIFASAQEPYAVMIDGNTAIEFRYDNEKAARGGMDIGPFDSGSDRPWSTYAEGIYSVIFDESFANCTSITSTAFWFSEFMHLEYIGGLEYLNTSNVTDMEEMFFGCKELQELNVSNFRTGSVTNMSSMFNTCTALRNIDVTNFNTSSVTNMSSMFFYCFGLEELDLTSFQTRNVTDMTMMFGFCPALTTIYVNEENWNTVYVSASNDMFQECQKLVGGMGTAWSSDHIGLDYAHIDFGPNNPGYLTARNGGGSSEEAQYWMELRSTLDYALDVQSRAQGHPNVEPWMQEELAMMIEKGSNMYDEHTAEEEEVRHMIEELKWICWEIEEAMNREPEPSGEAEPYAVLSDNNTVLTFYYDDQKYVRGGVGVGPFNADAIQLDDNEYFTTIWGTDSRNILRVVFDASFANCTTITNTSYWFESCSHMTEIIGLNYFNTSNVTDMNNMFEGCEDLTNLDLSSFNTTNVTTMFAMFRNCIGLKNINVSNFDTSNVKDMGSMFDFCTSLTSLDVSSFNTLNVTDMSVMFSRCSSLTKIYVRSGWSTANVSSSDYMFGLCNNLVGGRGTQWSEEHTDGAYAHIDGGVDNPGYLTDKNAEPIEGEARFDGLTAWVYGDATLDDAFAEVGRESAVQTIAAIVWEGTGALTAEQMQGITNPNLLVYVTEASKAPAGVRNVIVNGTAANITLSDASGNNNFFCPEPFTAQSISYTRNFSQTTEIGVSRGWETIALPFNVQSISHGGHGALVPFGGGNGGYPFWLHQLLSNGLTPVTAMEANTPYLICMPNNTVYPSAYNQAGSVTFASSNVTVPRTEPREAFGANVILTPAFQNQAAGSDIFTLNVGEAQGSYPEGSVFISNYRSVRPFQCYVRHSNQARGTDDIQFIPLTSIGGGDDTTAIMEIIQPAANGTGDWYSLDGRKLSSKPTQKGIYIQNGKKIVIK